MKKILFAFLFVLHFSIPSKAQYEVADNYQSSNINETLISKSENTDCSYEVKKKFRYRRQFLKERSCALLINITRIATLRTPLIGIVTLNLQKAAREHCYYMAERNVCSHTNFDNRRNIYGFRGENVAQGYRTGASFYWAWLNSKGHRENMLRRGYFFSGLVIYKKITIEKKYVNGKRKSKKRKVDTFAVNVFR